MKSKLQSINVLLVEDEQLIALTLSKYLRDLGHEVVHIKSSEEVSGALASNPPFDICFIDLDLERKRAGFDVLSMIKSENEKSFCVILTGHSESQYIEEGYDLKCDDYLIKPFNYSMISRVMDNFFSSERQVKFKELLAKHFVTQDSFMVSEFGRVAENINNDAPIFISGPTGSGKTVLAKIIHTARYGSEKAFADFNVSAVSDSLLESELFGHVKGAFTGADTNKDGYFTKAHGGTLFLDEIATMSSKMQNTLLKAIEEKSYYPVGSSKKLEADFRMISATCENIFDKIQSKDFREDLFYRISGINIKLKPLRERPRDVELMLNQIQSNFGDGRGLVIKSEARKALVNYDWPGNARELLAFFRSQQNMKKPIITMDILPDYIRNNENPFKSARNSKIINQNHIRFIEKHGYRDFIDEVSKRVVSFYMKENSYTKNAVMRKLGVTQHTLNKYLTQLEDEKCNTRI